MKTCTQGLLAIMLLFGFLPLVSTSTFCANAVASNAKAQVSTPADSSAKIIRFFNVGDMNRVTSVRELVEGVISFDASFGEVETLLALPATELVGKICNVMHSLPAEVQKRLNELGADKMVIIVNEVKAIDLLAYFVDQNAKPENIKRWPELVETAWTLLEHSPRYRTLGEKLRSLKDAGPLGVIFGLRGVLDVIPNWIKAKGQATGIPTLRNRIRS